jgi:flavin reductase (DIM6/NTAB) family NADH-FMN oxidoreductase RutF
MPITKEQFRDGMRQLAAAVTVITADHAGKRNGLTATAVMSVSAEPPRLAIAVNQSSSAFQLLIDAGAFAVNVLSYEQEDVASRFASGTIKGNARFDGSSWKTLETGAPVLENAATVFDCSVESSLQVGTHLLLVGAVKAIAVNPSDRPLLYLDGGYASLLKVNRFEASQYTTTVAKCLLAVDGAMAASGSAAEKLGHFVREFTIINIADTASTRVFLHQETYLPSSELAEINAARNLFDQKLRQLIRTGVESGEFNSDDPAIAALVITGMIGWIHRWYRQEGKYRPEEMAAKLTAMVLRMLQATPTPAITQEDKRSAT